MNPEQQKERPLTEGGDIIRKYIGHCENDNCERKNQEEKFVVSPDKVEAFSNEPPSCSKCGEFLQGDIHEVEK